VSIKYPKTVIKRTGNRRNTINPFELVKDAKKRKALEMEVLRAAIMRKISEDNSNT